MAKPSAGSFWLLVKIGTLTLATEYHNSTFSFAEIFV